jgi:cytochrome c peroxidase
VVERRHGVTPEVCLLYDLYAVQQRSVQMTYRFCHDPTAGIRLGAIITSGTLCLSAMGCMEDAEGPYGAAREAIDEAPMADAPPTIGSLRGVPVPEPEQLGRYVRSRSAAIQLGKALFWDVQAGSDGMACASCHFHAGADSRTKNQISPGLLIVEGPPRSETFARTASGGAGGPNYELTRDDWPFYQLADSSDRDSAIVFQTDDVASSSGVFHASFNALVPGSERENCTLLPDIFQVGGVHVRRAEPRHTPTVINAAFNFRNFWDGRANNRFNGVNPFGRRDTTAAIQVVRDGVLVREPVDLENASLASQAVGPPLSAFEMSCEGRTFPIVGRKLLGLRPLRLQEVDPSDSVLGHLRHTSGKGLNETYQQLIREAFREPYWNSAESIDGFSQMEANFSLFWGLAIQLYEATLVSDDSRVDRYEDGDSSALSEQERAGLQVFLGKGRCVNCHSGPQLTGAGSPLFAAYEEGGLVERMLMGDGGAALYDSGFYNIGVRPTHEDLGVGGLDPFGDPLSFARQEKRRAAGEPVPDPFRVEPGTFEVDPERSVDPGERDAVDGAFKVPTLRNIELTGPYFHNGSAMTLEQAVEFYNRGGNRRSLDGGGDTTGFGPNRSNLDPDISPIGLTASEKAALVALLKALTDERVRLEQAPFDHPQLPLPNGHRWSRSGVVDDGTGRACDEVNVLPAVGAAGRSAKGLPPLAPFTPAPRGSAHKSAEQNRTEPGSRGRVQR